MPSPGLEPDVLQVPQVSFGCSSHFRAQDELTYGSLHRGRRCGGDGGTELAVLTGCEGLPKAQGALKASSLTGAQVTG